MKKISQETEDKINEVYADLDKVFQGYIAGINTENQAASVFNVIERLGNLKLLEYLENSNKLASKMNEILIRIKSGKLEYNKDIIDMLILSSHFLREFIEREYQGKKQDSKYEFFMQELDKIIRSNDKLLSDKLLSGIKFKSEPSQISKIQGEQNIQVNWRQVKNLISLAEDLIRLQGACERQVDDILEENPGHPDIKSLSDMVETLDKIVFLIKEKVEQVQRFLAEKELESYSSTIKELSDEYMEEIRREEDAEVQMPHQSLWNQISDIIEDMLPQDKPDVRSSLWDILEPYETQFTEMPDDMILPDMESSSDSWNWDVDTDIFYQWEPEPNLDKGKMLSSPEDTKNIRHNESLLIKAIQEFNLSELPYFEEMLVTNNGQVYIILNRSAFF